MHVHCTALPLMKVESWKGKLLFRLHNTVCTATWLIHCKALHSLQGWSTVVLLGGIQYTGVQVCGRNTIWWECSYVGGRTTIWWSAVMGGKRTLDLTWEWEHALCDDLTQASLLFLTSWSSSLLLLSSSSLLLLSSSS